jgi:hypothetical protein
MIFHSTAKAATVTSDIEFSITALSTENEEGAALLLIQDTKGDRRRPWPMQLDASEAEELLKIIDGTHRHPDTSFSIFLSTGLSLDSKRTETFKAAFVQRAHRRGLELIGRSPKDGKEVFSAFIEADDLGPLHDVVQHCVDRARELRPQTSTSTL